MTAKNDVTGDSIITKVGKAKKAFDEGIKKIKPSCYENCKYLVNTLTKCRVCDWKNK